MEYRVWSTEYGMEYQVQDMEQTEQKEQHACNIYRVLNILYVLCISTHTTCPDPAESRRECKAGMIKYDQCELKYDQCNAQCVTYNINLGSKAGKFVLGATDLDDDGKY